MNESADYAEYIKNKNNKENDPAQPGFSFSVADEKTDITPETDAKDEPDTSELDNSIKLYKDLTKFDSWDDYYASFSDKEIKEMNKKDKNKLLDEVEFVAIRLEQARETIRINTKLEEINEAKKQQLSKQADQLENNQKAIEQERKDIQDRLKELDQEETKLKQSKDENKKQTRQIRSLIRANNKKIEEMEKITNNQTSIENEDEVNKKMEKIYEEIEAKSNVTNTDSEHKAPATKTSVTSDDFKEKEVKGEPKTIEPQAVVTLNDPASKEENKKTDYVKTDESTNDTRKNAFVDNATDVFAQAQAQAQAQAEEKTNNSDMSKEEKFFPTETTQNDLINEISDPNTFDESTDKVDETAPVQFDDMGLDPNTRAEIGLRARELYNNDSEKRSFDEYLMQAKQELTEQENSKGKTR